MAKRQVTRLTPRAQAILDWMVAHPGRPYKECAREVGCSENWISIVANSEVFQRELRRRREAIQQGVDAKVERTLVRGISKLEEQLEVSQDPDFILAAVDSLAGHVFRAKGGEQGTRGQQVQQNVMVADTELMRRLVNAQLDGGE